VLNGRKKDEVGAVGWRIEAVLTINAPEAWQIGIIEAERACD
jgi:hypothetical protein